MASTARARLLQLQRRLSFGLFRRHHQQSCSSSSSFLKAHTPFHYQQQLRHSPSLLLQAHTTLHQLLPSSRRSFATVTDPNEGKQHNTSDVHNETTYPHKFFRMLPSFQRDLRVKFTHPTCGTKMERLVCKKSFEIGAVLGRCNGCNSYVVIADNHQLFPDSTSVKKFIPAHGEKIEEGSDRTLNFLCEFKEKEIQQPDPLSVFVKWDERDHTVRFTHDCDTRLSTRLSRMVFEKAREKGLVATRCNGCNSIVFIADHYGLLKPPSCTKYADLVKWYHSKVGRTVRYLCHYFEKELEEGSQETINLTLENPDSTEGIPIDWPDSLL